MRPQPFFLLSPPRSGSTLVQRILASHAEVATVSEPWILLPLLCALRGRGVYAAYSHADLVRALEDFLTELPGGRQDWNAAIREFALCLYGRAAREKARYFLDKTPRYSLVADELMRTFPDAKYLFLWRNPLAVIASIAKTWADGRWNLHYFKVDLFDGVANLVDAFSRHGASTLALRYEDLVREPAKHWPGVFAYLGLDWDPALLHSFSGVELRGRKGDRGGAARSEAITTEPLSTWQRVLANPARKAWCRRYLRWLGRERLALMGYDQGELLSQLDAIPSSPRRLASDLARMSYGVAYSALELRQLRHKLQALPRWHRIHSHR